MEGWIYHRQFAEAPDAGPGNAVEFEQAESEWDEEDDVADGQCEQVLRHTHSIHGRVADEHECTDKVAHETHDHYHVDVDENQLKFFFSFTSSLR